MREQKNSVNNYIKTIVGGRKVFGKVKEKQKQINSKCTWRMPFASGLRLLGAVLSICMIMTTLTAVAFAATVNGPGGTVSTNSALQEALGGNGSAEIDGDTVKLVQDVTLDNNIKVNGTIILDLNGHTLSFAGANSSENEYNVLFYIMERGNLTIKDSNGQGKIEHTRNNAGKGDYTVYCRYDSSEVTIENGTFSGGVRTGSGSVRIQGGTFSAFTVDNAKAISVSAGKFQAMTFMGTLRLPGIVAEGSYSADSAGKEVSGWKNNSNQYPKNIWIRNAAEAEKQLPKITADLSTEMSYCKEGETKTLSITASVGDGSTLTYQWYQNSRNSVPGTLISNANTNSFTVPTTSAGTTYYYVEVTNPNTGISVRSKLAAVTVSESGHGPGGTANSAVSLQNALGGSSSAEINSDTVKLVQDVTLDNNIKVNGTIILDLNGHTLSFAGANSSENEYNVLFYIMERGNLTIKDSNGQGKIEHTRNNAGKGDYTVYCRYDSSEVTIENGTFSGGVRTGSGSVRIQGGTFSAFTVDNAKAISVSAGEFNNITFMSNTLYRMPDILTESTYVTKKDGQELANWANLQYLNNIMVVPLGTGSTITYWLQEQINKAEGVSDSPTEIKISWDNAEIVSTITVPENKYVKLTGNTLTRAVEFSSAPLFNVKGELTLENITLDGNKENNASGDGLLEVDGGKLTLNDGAILQNNSGWNGGAVRVCYGGSVNMNGGKITGNEALVGGAIYVFNYIGETGGTFTMKGGEISGNTAEAGSGVYITDEGTFNLHSGAVLTGNTASENVSQDGWGGTIDVEIRPLSGTRSILNKQTRNVSRFNINFPSSPDSWGGGVYNMGTFTMDGGEISGNIAGRGGAVYHAAGSCTITGGEITGNGNTYSGTGLYAREDAVIGGDANIADGIYLVTGKTIFVSSALNNQVKIEGMEGDVTEGTVIADGSGHSISDDDFAKFVYQPDEWKLVKSAEGKIMLASKMTAAPEFESEIQVFGTAESKTVTFTLTNAIEGGKYKIYDTEVNGTPLSDPTVRAEGNKMTLTFTSKPAEDKDYYVSVTAGEDKESTRTKIKVQKFLPPSVILGSDAKVTVKFAYGDSADTVRSDSIDITTTAGTATSTFTASDFSISSSDTANTAIGGVNVTDIGQSEPGSTILTVAVAKSVTADSGYLWYGENLVGKITLAKTVEEASTDATLSALSYKVGDGNDISVPDFVSATETYDVELPQDTDKNAVISLAGTVNDEKAFIHTNNGVTLENGEGTAEIIVSAESGATKTYSIVFTTAQAPTPEQSAAPVFSQASYTKQSADENTAEFTLTTAAESATTFKVYTNEAGDEIPSGITASANETVLTLEGISAVTASTDYYITATEQDKTESARVKVTVKPYTPTPSYSITYTLQNLTAENQPSSVESGKSLTAVLKAADGYKLPDSITVTMGNITLKNESDYTYDRTAGTVNVSNVTGNVTITAEGEKDTTFVAVTEITGVPNMATVGKTLQLTGTVQPSDATNREIIWDITDEGETGATLDEDNKLTATASGIVTITATITGGLEDGDYIQEFMITVAGTASSSDAEYVEKAVKAVEDGNYAVEQSTSENEDSFLTELANLINKILEKLFGAGNTERITTGDIDSMITVNAVAGDEENPDGTDGEFEFSVEIHKGEESTKVEGLTGTIRAAKFTDEEQQQKDQEAVNAAIEKIEGGTYNIPQSKARTEAALKRELKKRAKSKAGNNVTVNDIQITEVELAVAGTKDNPEGTQGSFTFEACVSKGSVRDIWTVELDGTIAPEKYVLKKPSITTGSLPDGTAGEAYEVELKAESDTAVTWAVSDGSLPDGISLDTDGTISGTPETAGTYTVTVSAENGSEQGSAEKTYTITINEPSGKTEHTITASAGTGGTISPSGAVMVADGGNQTFTITAASGYYVSDVLADGTSVGRQTSYEFKNVTGDHTIEAVFTRGSIGPNGGGSGGSGGGGGSSSSTGSSQTTTPSTTTNTAATENGGSVTTTQTTSKDASGKTTTVTTQVTKDPSGNVTGTTTTVTTDNVTTSTDQGNAIINVQPNAAAINSAAGAAGATAENPMDVMVSIPKEIVLNEVQKAEVSSVQVNVVLPKAVSDNTAVQTIGVTIEKEAVDAAKAAGKNLEVTVRKEDGSLEAVWSLNGQSMQNAAGETTDLNLGVHTAPVQSADPTAAAVKPTVAAKGHENGLVLTITASGTLLSPAKVTVPATDQTGITAGTAVTLYRYDQTTGALNAVPGGVYTVDANGNVTIDFPAGTRAGAKESYVLLPTQGAQGTHAGGSTTHTIKGGDTLNTISRQYGCTVADIMALNPGLDIYDLRVGSGLIIPGKQ